MEMMLIKEFYNKLKDDKIKINWNKNPIKMSLFLSFLTVQVEISRDHLGSDTGWTLKKNEDLKLLIGGGIVNGTEYLDTLQYGVKLSNPYNNYVNPFFLFDILTEEGKAFFVEYYKDDISKILSDQIRSVEFYKNKLQAETELLDLIQNEVVSLTPSQTDK